LEGGPPRFRPRFTGAVLLRNSFRRLPIPPTGRLPSLVLGSTSFGYLRNLVTPARPATAQTNCPTTPEHATRSPLTRARFGLIPFRSPLLRESRLIYFPRGTEMFHFPRLPPPRLCVQRGVTPHYQRWVSPFGHPRIKGYSAPTRGLSQPFTPFIGSRCQGIHHVPLLS
jgi:hypothetical protein